MTPENIRSPLVFRKFAIVSGGINANTDLKRAKFDSQDLRINSRISLNVTGSLVFV